MSITAERKKTTCPISRKGFRASAKPIVLRAEANSQSFVLNPKDFSTGSLGWNANEKLRMELEEDGVKKMVTVQVGINFTIVGSKELPAE